VATELRHFVTEELELAVANGRLQVKRAGFRSIIKDEHAGTPLSRHIANVLPYYYREPCAIASDFKLRLPALDAVNDLMAAAPTTAKFRKSHCGEILCAHYLESMLHLRRLYSKLTLTTAENTNVHKMDAFFVYTLEQPYTYYAVEAKSSVLPTGRSKNKSHRSGVLKQLIESMENANEQDFRFDFLRIRDNLERDFNEKEASVIRRDLMPPGPERLVRVGMAVINTSTVNQDDDDYILCTDCTVDFGFRSIVVADLAKLASEAYGAWDQVAEVTRV
jgi:hypothetical protein